VFELGRSDIGFGKLIVDERGVTRTKLFGRETILWDDVRDYRVKVEFRAHDPNVLLNNPITDVKNVVEAFRGNSKRRYGMSLFGESSRVAFNWRFRDVALAITFAIEQIDARITNASRALLEQGGEIRFGKLRLAAAGLLVGGAYLSSTQVEAIELFDASSLELRVMRKGKVWPLATMKFHTVPNPYSALAIAEELGYVIKGRELLPRFAPPEARVVR
jgi:hypothetical protein